MDTAEQTLEIMRRYVDTTRAAVVDARSMGGEVIALPVLSQGQDKETLSAVADNLTAYMQKVTGRGYSKAEEVYDIGFTVREPGHESYGMKLLMDQGQVVISRVALLEDESIFQRYVNYLKSGLLL